MTPWNPMNVFRLRDSDVAGADASSAFDPTRTGDPLTSPTREFGRGLVGGGEGATLDTPHRNPIGFGPPAEIEQPAPVRYRTEISFKRHQAPVSSTRSTSGFSSPATRSSRLPARAGSVRAPTRSAPRPRTAAQPTPPCPTALPSPTWRSAAQSQRARRACRSTSVS